jgi:spore coat protein U-like protein
MARGNFALRLMFAAVATLCAAGIALAQNSTTTQMTVTAAVSGPCTVSPPTINIISYNAATPAGSNPVTISVACPSNVAATVTLSKGHNAGVASSVTCGLATKNACNRAMSNGTNIYLDYDIYQDANLKTLWGDGTTPGFSAQKTTAGGGLVTGYIDIPAGQTAPGGGQLPVGTFSDTVTITVSW